jgi:hypothetical protein
VGSNPYNLWFASFLPMTDCKGIATLPAVAPNDALMLEFRPCERSEAICWNAVIITLCPIYFGVGSLNADSIQFLKAG